MFYYSVQQFSIAMKTRQSLTNLYFTKSVIFLNRLMWFLVQETMNSHWLASKFIFSKNNTIYTIHATPKQNVLFFNLPP
jgi:hypothetical protein